MEPGRLRVAEGEDVRRDPVEEPPIVADDGAAGELDERLLERAERVDVEVVRRLVEEEQATPARSSFARCTRFRPPPDTGP